MKLSTELRDIKNIIFNKERYKADIITRYSDSLTGIEDLLGTGHKELSTLFYLLNRHWLFLLSNDPKVTIDKHAVERRRIIYRAIKKFGVFLMPCAQRIEHPAWIDCPVGDPPLKTPKIDLPNKPVIFVSNHGFRDDVVATVLAAEGHAYKICGSLPMFYNTIDGFASLLIGDIVVNRKCGASRKSSVEKAKKVLSLGTNLIIYPEGIWNKTIEKPSLHLWAGVYEISKATNCDVVPIVHYNREPEVRNKNNVIHTVIGNPIPLYTMEKDAALQYLRDVLSTWQYKLMEIYGRSTREEEMQGFTDKYEKWRVHLKDSVGKVEWYDEETERNADYRPKDIIRPEDVFRPIANIKNITAKNVKNVLYAQSLVKLLEESDWQRLV